MLTRRYMDFLTVKDLTEMGFGSRVTIWKKVKQHEFPAPMKFGNSVNAPNRWDKRDIDVYVAQLKARAIAKYSDYGATMTTHIK